MKFITNNQLKKYIDDNIDEAEIMAHYMDIPITDIYKCINNKSHRVHNKFRDDNNPSYGFQYVRSKKGIRLWAKDFANPFYTGDKYHIVGLALKLNCNTPKDFVNICKHIIKTFNGIESVAIPKKEQFDKKVYTHNIFKIDVTRRNWNNDDLKYWGSMGYNYQTLISEKIYPISQFSLNSTPNGYFYHKDDPAYAYHIGFKTYDLWEIYRPFAPRYLKFRTNNISDIKELHLIRKNHNLILTKSKKEKGLFKQMIDELEIYDTDVLYTSEAIKLSSSVRSKIDNHYRNIYVNFDIDKAGIDGMKYFNAKYGYYIFPFVLEDMLKITPFPKDATDFVKRFGYDNAVKLFKTLYNKYIKL